MSLKTCVRIGIGILASSGAVALLSGGALAANNGQDTTSQNVHVQRGGNGPQVTGGVQSFQYYQSSEDNGTDQTAGTQDQNVTGTPGSTNSQTNGVQPGSDSTNTNGAQVANSVTSKPSQQSIAPSGKDNGGGQGQGGLVAKPGNTDGGAGGSVVGSANSTVAVPEVAVVTPALPADPSSGGIQPVTHTTILPIQPVITNRTAALTPDLAETMPSAPAPSRAPVPTKSTGVLAGLVVGLSNVVVPQPVTPTNTVWLRVMLAVSLLAVVVLLANVFEFSYGQWLRRGGFATAARSDEPLNGSTSPLFATPLLSGYVEQPPRLHNLILLVVLVPNAYRKEDRR